MNKKIVLISLHLLLFEIGISLGQSPGGIKSPMVWQIQNNPLLRESISYELFNFNAYEPFGTPSNKSIDLKTEKLGKVSLFLVYNNKTSQDVGELKCGNKKIVITDSSVISKRIHPYIETNTKPKFLTYIESIKGVSKKEKTKSELNLGLNSIKNEFNSEGNIAEVIFYDKLLSRKQIDRVESYLSIKYGISLPLESKYYSSRGDIIWEPKLKEEFIHNVTAIACDRGSNLNQVQSKNLYSDFDLTIGAQQVVRNVEIKNSSIPDQSFLFWADNGKSSNLESKSADPNIKSMNRIWKFTSIGKIIENNKYAFKVQLSKEMGIRGFNTLWLKMSNSKKGLASDHFAQRIPMFLQSDGSYQANLNVNINTQAYFSFEWGPLFEVQAIIDEQNCDLAYADIKLLVKTAASQYSISFNQQEIYKSNVGSENQKTIAITHAPYGAHEIQITAKEDHLTRTITLFSNDCPKNRKISETEIQIYPNPLRIGSEVEITASGFSDHQSVRLNILESNFKMITSNNLTSINGLIHHKELIRKAGFYIIELKQGDILRTSKLVVIE